MSSNQFLAVIAISMLLMIVGDSTAFKAPNMGPAAEELDNSDAGLGALSPGEMARAIDAADKYLNYLRCKCSDGK